MLRAATGCAASVGAPAARPQSRRAGGPNEKSTTRRAPARFRLRFEHTCLRHMVFIAGGSPRGARPARGTARVT
eukprot:969757-Prymnesium_polylepis.1